MSLKKRMNVKKKKFTADCGGYLYLTGTALTCLLASSNICFAGCLIAVLNYEFEEKDECEKPTNFTVKVAGVNNKLHENIIVKCKYRLVF